MSDVIPWIYRGCKLSKVLIYSIKVTPERLKIAQQRLPPFDLQHTTEHPIVWLSVALPLALAAKLHLGLPALQKKTPTTTIARSNATRFWGSEAQTGAMAEAATVCAFTWLVNQGDTTGAGSRQGMGRQGAGDGQRRWLACHSPTASLTRKLN
jgi:hypothetical protein